MEHVKAAQLISDNIDTLINQWVAIAKDSVEASVETPKLILIDHLPDLLQDIAENIQLDSNIEKIEKGDFFENVIKHSAIHGRHRAATEFYTIGQVIHEYIILHRILTDFLEEHGLYGIAVSKVLKYIIEASILQASASFVASIENMQEKLMATLVHDIRGPLLNAKGCLGVLEQETDPVKFKQLKNIADYSLGKSLRLTEELMDSVAVKAGEGLMMQFCKGDFVKELNTVYTEIKEIYSQEVILEKDAEHVYGVFDAAAIRRILENLLTNAIKYGDADQPITLGIQEAGDEVTFCVKNEGEPIPVENRQSILDFLSAKQSENQTSLKSWGVGLTFVQMAVNAHGGYLKVESTQETGTTFSFTIKKRFKEEGNFRAYLNQKSE